MTIKKQKKNMLEAIQKLQRKWCGVNRKQCDTQGPRAYSEKVNVISCMRLN